ncbi:hypothetical protein Taro_002356 [Colocasia esculenta]|uniref:Uncharacterized protein n=1 Tax=Colocasia esculenta TaxID=4460 RepID=A0A843TLD1_COLES|nr:hypothetical protein [Colocasia esculenta]
MRVATGSSDRAADRDDRPCHVQITTEGSNLKNEVDGLRAPSPHEFSSSLVYLPGPETLGNELGPAMEVAIPTVPPPLVTSSGPSTGASTVPQAEDAVSLQEGGGSFYDATLWEVWINGFNNFPMDVQELLYQMFELDSTLWREHAPTWMRRDYWQRLCNIWAEERWHETSTTMKVNRAANLEANKHTSGSISFATHQSRLENELKWPPTFQEVFDKLHKKKGTDQYVSDKAQEVAESYSQQMIEKYVGEEKQPQLDLEATSAFTTPGAPGVQRCLGLALPGSSLGFLSGPLLGQHSCSGSVIDISTGPSCE